MSWRRPKPMRHGFHPRSKSPGPEPVPFYEWSLVHSKRRAYPLRASLSWPNLLSQSAATICTPWFRAQILRNGHTVRAVRYGTTKDLDIDLSETIWTSLNDREADPEPFVGPPPDEADGTFLDQTEYEPRTSLHPQDAARMRGLWIDLGFSRRVWDIGIVSALGNVGPVPWSEVVTMPRWIDDDRFDRRHEELEERLAGRVPGRRWWFLGVAPMTILPDPLRLMLWSSHSGEPGAPRRTPWKGVPTLSLDGDFSIERATERICRRLHLRPRREQETWESNPSNVERGRFLWTSREEIDLAVDLGLPHPVLDADQTTARTRADERRADDPWPTSAPLRERRSDGYGL